MNTANTRNVLRLAAAAGLCAAAPALAQPRTFHVIQMQMVIGGVNGDVTKQAIQMRMRSDFQNQFQNALIRAWDATGANPVVIADGMTAVTNFSTGDTVLITSTEFDSSTTPACVADFHMMNHIPAS